MNHSISILLCILAFLPFTLAGGANAADFPLARDGRPVACIVTSVYPTRASAFAAWELREHVRKITGAELPIVTADAMPPSSPRILVGESEATRKLGLRSADFEDQEYLIRFSGDTLILMGRDAPEPASESTVLGKLHRAPGKSGYALEFDGATAVSFDAAGFDDAAGAMEAWVWLPENPPPHPGTILRLDGSDPWTYHILERQASSNRIRYIAYDGKSGHAVHSRPLSPGWHHVSATHDATTAKIALYIDGEKQGEAPYTKTTCHDAALRIGGLPAAHGGVSNGFVGRIDEVCLSMKPAAPPRPLKTTHTASPELRLLLHFEEPGDHPPRDASGTVRSFSPPPRFEAQATSYAVHDFLERFCGVRWFGPGETGLVVPTRRTLTVKPRNIRRRPALGYRDSSPMYPTGMTRAIYGDPSHREMDLFWARLRAGGKPYSANHSFYGYYDRFWRKNPKNPGAFESPHLDWFARGYKGKPPQMCYSNPKFIQQVVRDARNYFDGKGLKPGAKAAGDFFALVPMDNNHWCQCPKCQTQMNRDQETNQHFSTGFASDYFFGFANQVARQIQKSHPGKFLSTLAYYDYAYYPAHTRLAPNLSVQMCLHVRNWWAPSMERNDMKIYRSWVSKEKDRPLYLWLYYCFPYEKGRRGGWGAFPGFFAHTAARQIKMFARDGIRGAFLNGLGEQVDTYVTFKLFDDPSLDIDAVLDDFFARYYGAAAEPMKRLYLRIEEIYSNPKNYPPAVQHENRHFHQTEEMAWGWLGTPERMAELANLMKQAKNSARTSAEKRRVALFDQAIWSPMLEGRRAYDAKHRNSGE